MAMRLCKQTERTQTQESGSMPKTAWKLQLQRLQAFAFASCAVTHRMNSNKWMWAWLDV